MRVLSILICALLILALPVVTVPVAAQSNLTEGMTVSGQSGAHYQLTASAGDLIVLEAIGISSDFTPVLTLLNPTGDQVAQAQNDPLTPGTTTLAYKIPADGLYSLSVTGLYGASGQFVLTLTGSPSSAAQALSAGDSSLPIDTTAQVYQFNAPAEIMISGNNLDFSAEVRDPNGALVTELEGVPQAALEIDASGTFELTLHAEAAGQVSISYTSPPDLAITAEATPEATLEATAQAVAETETAAPSETPTPLPPTVTPTPSNTLTPTETFTPTETPSPTYTPSSTATPTPTPIPVMTVTPAATPQTQNVQIAPRDNSYQVTITLSNAFTSSDVVSYPKGDREDTVFYTVNGLNSNANVQGGQARLQITALCNGSGTEFIEITVSKQTYHCGDTIVDRTVTYATRTGSLHITATGGDATYVQWELIGNTTPLQ